nr:uncharacterized protein LOC109164037 [Ipomoea batatas]
MGLQKRNRHTRSASQSNVDDFYRDASDEDSDSSKVDKGEFAGQHRVFAMGHGSPPKNTRVPFGGRVTRSQTKERLRDPLWAELYSVSDKVPIGVPWSVVGDFNCLLNVDEKRGGLPYPHRKTTDFRECVSTCDLIDSSAYGSSFTWWNGRRKESAIWMRLDRFLYTSAWELIFKTSVQHLSRTSSDHCPLLVTSQALSVQHISKHFIFLNVWTKHEDFLRVVKESWDVPIDGAPMYILATKLSRLSYSGSHSFLPSFAASSPKLFCENWNALQLKR